MVQHGCWSSSHRNSIVVSLKKKKKKGSGEEEHILLRIGKHIHMAHRIFLYVSYWAESNHRAALSLKRGQKNVVLSLGGHVQD